MSRALGFALVGAGAAAAVAGAIVLFRDKKRGELSASSLGKSKSGMKLTHFRSRNMPIAERMKILQDLTYKSVQDPEMRKLALQITHHCKARDELCEARSIYDWIKQHIRYSGDVGPHRLGSRGPVEGVDLFQTAARTVEFGAGDCDDHAILGCTLALHNGLPCRYRDTSPTRSRKRDDYSHIYAMVGVPKAGPSRWIASDTTLPNGSFGTQAPYGKHLDFVA